MRRRRVDTLTLLGDLFDLMSRFGILKLTIVGAVLMATAATHATQRTFTIDSQKSRLTLSGSVMGSALREQGAGSLAAAIEGTIEADVKPISIQFTGKSSIRPVISGTWQPGIDGVSGSAPANYGALADVLFTKVQTALRDVNLAVQSSALSLSSGGSFNGGGLSFSFSQEGAAALDYNAGFISGRLPLAGLSASNLVQQATLTTNSTEKTISIPVDAEFKFSIASTDDTKLRVTGQIVATFKPVLAITGIQVSNNRLVLTVDGGTASVQLQTSADLKTWQSRTVNPLFIGDSALFSMEIPKGTEFFRVGQ
jgi:hypothetical protein